MTKVEFLEEALRLNVKEKVCFTCNGSNAKKIVESLKEKDPKDVGSVENLKIFENEDDKNDFTIIFTDKDGNIQAWMSCVDKEDEKRISYQIIRTLAKSCYMKKYSINIFRVR